MRNALLALVAGAALTVATSAKADTHALVRGTYCSAATTDGLWAFTWSLADVFTNCNIVENSLRNRTLSPVQRYTRGYYWADGVNRVYVSCFGGTNWFTGVGYQPLQAAYNYAGFYNGLGCTFTVN